MWSILLGVKGMKRIVSVSIGSPVRDKKVQTKILGEEFIIERIGTNGDLKKAVRTIRELDGRVSAFGMGGIDLYIRGVKKIYTIRDALLFKEAAQKSPIVDGTGIKNTLEERVVKWLDEKGIIKLEGKRVLVTCAADRFKMTKAFDDAGSSLVIGDLMFALDVPVPIKSIKAFGVLAALAIPVLSRLPFEMLYPIGEKQKENDSSKYAKYYKRSDIIAGDFHYIKKYMPEDMTGKVIVTNTVTVEDVQMLKSRGLEILITTTPEFDGRSFGTNVLEAILVSVSGKHPGELTEQDYYEILDKLSLKPRVEYLNVQK